MQSVRRRITEILKENGSATVAELADELGMAQVSVRHHLDILVGEDLVELTGVRRRDGAGRPSQVYALTPNALALFPQRNAQLANSVLTELKAVLPERRGGCSCCCGSPSAQLREAPRPVNEQTVEERLDQVTDFLTQKGYSARWESCDGYFELHACNCPYSGVAEQHPGAVHDGPCDDPAAAARCGPFRLHSPALTCADGANRCTYVLKPSRFASHAAAG